MEMEWYTWVQLFFGFAGAAFSGLRWYSEWKQSRKRNNPPSHDSKTDRFIG
jgi:hypothetical protein